MKSKKLLEVHKEPLTKRKQKKYQKKDLERIGEDQKKDLERIVEEQNIVVNLVGV